MNKLSFEPYANKHIGERCFILGNGPSLKEENLELLKNEKIFIVNRGYFALDIDLDHYDYYVLTDLRVYSEDAKEIQNNVNCPRFYSSLITKNKSYLEGPKEDFVSIIKFDDKDKRKMGIIRNIMPAKFEDGWGKTRTVAFDASLVAFFMGFKEIYLLGVDLSDSTTDTHFYESGLREKALKGEFLRNPQTWPIIINNLTNFYKTHSVKFVNLSKGFCNRYPMNVNTLENVVSNKLRT